MPERPVEPSSTHPAPPEGEAGASRGTPEAPDRAESGDASPTIPSTEAPTAGDAGVAADGAEAPVAVDPNASRRRRREGPRRVRNGLKLRRKDGPLPFPADRWKAALLGEISEDLLIAGEDYARQGQITAFAIVVPDLVADRAREVVRIDATVQGSAPRPYATSIEILSWTRIQWEAAIKAMAQEAIYSAKLLAGELPIAVEELCAALGAQLLPRPEERFTIRCTCEGASETGCKHMVAATLLMIERLAEAPLIAFNLRGLPHETAMARLHEARALHTHGHSAAHGAATPRSATRPFEACLADFWRPGPQLAELDRPERPEHVPHALLRRLGPSPLQGKFPLVGLLASIYDSVREEAKRIRGDL